MNEIVKVDVVDQFIPPTRRRYLFYLMGGGNLEFDSTKERVEEDKDRNLWIVYHNDAKDTVTYIPTHQLVWMRSWNA